MSDLNVHIVPVLSDNYVYVIEGSEKKCAVIDPGEAQPVIDFIEKNNLVPEMILITHHHGDHVGGVEALSDKYAPRIMGPAKSAGKLPGDVRGLSEGDNFTLFDCKVEILDTPGHTLDHICYYIPSAKMLFAGDTLFSLGCGRVFEGTMDEMYHSLQKLADLPDDIRLYCGHEYTLSNLNFALSLAPGDENLRSKKDEIESLRKKQTPTLPASLGEEKQLNPFLTARNVEEFTERRRKKDAA